MNISSLDWAALDRIREVRKDPSRIEIAIPAFEAVLCENCGFISRSQHGDVSCGKCGSKATVWISQLVQLTGGRRRA